jgi:hypothetical protein
LAAHDDSIVVLPVLIISGETPCYQLLRYPTIPHDCYHLHRSRFVRYLPALFVPPAKDPHAKRNEGKKLEWRSVWGQPLGNFCAWQSATGTHTVHSFILIFFILPSHMVTLLYLRATPRPFYFCRSLIVIYILLVLHLWSEYMIRWNGNGNEWKGVEGSRENKLGCGVPLPYSCLLLFLSRSHIHHVGCWY